MSSKTTTKKTYFQVKNVTFPDTQILGGRSAFQLNLALLEMSTKITLNPTVIPACLQWNGEKTTLPKGTLLKVRTIY